jgi:hypothetical protein
MTITAAAVLVCALDLLARPMPPIVLLDARPLDVSPNAEGFVRRNPDTIYVLTDTDVFEDARRGDHHALRKIASILVHEEWHLRHGADETGAYQAQLLELLRLGETPERWTYRAVARAFRYVTRSRPRVEGALASTR